MHVNNRVFEVHVCELLHVLPSEQVRLCLSPEEIREGSDLFVNVFSDANADGKTSLIQAIEKVAQEEGWGQQFSFLPEAKNRRRRLGGLEGVREERYGVDLIYYPAKRIHKAIRNGKMFLAYEVKTVHIFPDDTYQCIGERTGGITVSCVVRAIRSRRKQLMTIPPLACRAMRTVFPMTQCVYIRTQREMQRHYRKLRKIEHKYDLVTIGWLDQYLDPMPGIKEVLNIPDETEAMVASVEPLLRAGRVKDLYSQVVDLST